MRKQALLIIVLISSTAALAQSRHEQIKTKLSSLQSLIGEWETSTQLTQRSGNRRNEEGIYDISWALDSTYIRWHGRLKNIENGRERQFICWLTYDLKKQAYRKSFIYSRTSNQVEAIGQFDENKMMLVTNTSFLLSDGVRESIRDEISMVDPDLIIDSSWASFDGSDPFNNFTATMKRIK